MKGEKESGDVGEVKGIDNVEEREGNWKMKGKKAVEG